MITIITVVLNDLSGLIKTVESVANQKKINPDIEYIVVDGGSTDGSVDIITSNLGVIDKYVSEPDRGIYDAMNKGLNLARGTSLLFLNAGDYFVGEVLLPHIVAPIFLPVKYVDYLGRFRLRPIESIFTGIPNCHQGILFENKSVVYDLQYKICADYKYFIEHGYGNKLLMADVNGYVFFDNNGINGRNVQIRDQEILNIRIKYFGPIIGYLFEVWPASKRLVRMVANFFV